MRLGLKGSSEVPLDQLFAQIQNIILGSLVFTSYSVFGGYLSLAVPTLPCHYKACHAVRDAGACSQERDAHYDIWDAQSEPNNSDLGGEGEYRISGTGQRIIH